MFFNRLIMILINPIREYPYFCVLIILYLKKIKLFLKWIKNILNNIFSSQFYHIY